MDMEKATLKLRGFKFFYFISLLIPILVFVAYGIYSVFYTPDKRSILLNQMGGVYINEDLSKTNMSEGEVKQYLAETIAKTFTYNYISFSEKDTYQKKLDREISSDLPDHRDAIRPLFSDNEWKRVVVELENADWMRDFHYNRYKIFANLTSPPVQVAQGGWYPDSSGRLNVDYEGNIFLRLTGLNVKNKMFKVSYTATLERKAMMASVLPNQYYFPPMVPMNTFEWRVKSLKWNSTQRF